MDVLDLDVMVPVPKNVRFGGVEYELPADLPMEIFLQLNQASTFKNEDGSEDQLRQINYLTDTLAGLFTWQLEEKGVDEEARKAIKDRVHTVLMRRGTRYCFTLIQEIYRDEDQAADEAESDPTPPPPPPAEG